MAECSRVNGHAKGKAIDEFFTEMGSGQLAMGEWADATGGAAYYNSNDLAGLLAKAIAKGSDYYTLSYVPPGRKYDGRHHAIHVELSKPGLKLVYRNEYYAEDPTTIKPTPGLTLAAVPDPARQIDMRNEMSRSMPTSTDLLFDVHVVPASDATRQTDPKVIGVLDPKLKSKPLTRYTFSYSIPGQEISLASDSGNRHGSLEFDLVAFDGDGNVVTSLRQAIRLNLTVDQAAEFANAPFGYQEQLDLPAGPLFLRIGVLDRTSNKLGTLEIPLTIPDEHHKALPTP